MSTAASSTLAVDGGSPVRSTPFPTRRLFGEAEKAAAVALFDRAIADGSHLLGYGGDQERAYCEAFAAYHGGGYADAVNAGSTAVYVALRAMELRAGSEVIVPPITDPGGVMPVALMGCIPVCADAAPGSYNAGPEQIAERITPRTSAILVAHISGQPVDLDPILDLARAHDLPVIEDCAQAHGATYRGRMVGTFGAVAAYSTMFGKHHATGGQGGVVFTTDEARYWTARRMSDRGKPFGLQGTSGNVAASLNFNLDELSCAIGCVQLERLPAMLAHRRALAARLEAGCREQLQGVRLSTGLAHSDPAWWFFLFRIDWTQYRVDKATFVHALRTEGIPATSSYYHCPIEHDWFRKRQVFAGSELPWSAADPATLPDIRALPNARATDDAHIMLGLHEGYTEQEIDDIVAALAKVEAAYRR